MAGAPAAAARAITFDPAHTEGTDPVKVRPLDESLSAQERSAGLITKGAWLLADPDESMKGALEGAALEGRWQDMSSSELVDAIRGLPKPGARDLSEHERRAASAAANPKSRRRRRPRLTDHELCEMAKDHQRFDRLVNDPTIQVAKKWHMSRSTASRNIRRARELGYL
jgi:hypothetical protein